MCSPFQKGHKALEVTDVLSEPTAVQHTVARSRRPCCLRRVPQPLLFQQPAFALGADLSIVTRTFRLG